jgi:hypothetical protein
MMFRGIGFDLGSVQTYRAQFHESHLMGHQQDLREQGLQLFEKPPAEGGDGVMIRVHVDGNITECHRIVSGLFDLAAGKYSGCISIEEQRHHHARRISIRPPACIKVSDRRKIET